MTFVDEMDKAFQATSGLAALEQYVVPQSYLVSLALAFNTIKEFGNPLTPVVITAPVSGNLIQYNGTNWVNVARISWSNLPNGNGTWTSGGGSFTSSSGGFAFVFAPSTTGAGAQTGVDIQHTTTGATTQVTSFQVEAFMGAGTPNELFNIRVLDAFGTGAPLTQYGVWIAAMTKGSTTNWALYTVGPTKSFFGGSIDVRGVAYTWPAASAVGILNNDGTGILSWAAAGAAADAYPAALGYANI